MFWGEISSKYLDYKNCSSILKILKYKIQVIQKTRSKVKLQCSTGESRGYQNRFWPVTELLQFYGVVKCQKTTEPNLNQMLQCCEWFGWKSLWRKYMWKSISWKSSWSSCVTIVRSRLGSQLPMDPSGVQFKSFICTWSQKCAV